MSDALVRAAFETRLAAWAAAQTPPIPVSFQNVAFTPPTGRYVRCWLLPAPTQSRGIGGTDRERKGIVQIDLCLPIGTGSKMAADLANSLDAAFPLTGPMTQGGIEVWMTSPLSAASPIEGPTHYTVPLSGSYLSHTV